MPQDCRVVRHLQPSQHSLLGNIWLSESTAPRAASVSSKAAARLYGLAWRSLGVLKCKFATGYMADNSYACTALGAIGIAAVGVYGVLQLSLMVAQGTGRSIMADKQKQEAEQQARSQSPVRE